MEALRGGGGGSEHTLQSFDECELAAWHRWLLQYRSRLDSWWLSLPPATGAQMRTCGYFLGGALTSRFDAWLNALQRLGGSAMGAAAPPPAVALRDDPCAHLPPFFFSNEQKNAFCPSLPKCRTPTFAICPELNSQNRRASRRERPRDSADAADAARGGGAPVLAPSNLPQIGSRARSYQRTSRAAAPLASAARVAR